MFSSFQKNIEAQQNLFARDCKKGGEHSLSQLMKNLSSLQILFITGNLDSGNSKESIIVVGIQVYMSNISSYY